MIDQISLDSTGYWFALVSAAPVPELPEKASVAVLFGNGRPFRLSFQKGLPRLASLAPVDQSSVFEAVLESMREDVSLGRLSVHKIQSMLGAQLRIEPLRPLVGALTDELVEKVERHYLAAVVQPEREGSPQAVVRSSRRLLDSILNRSAARDLRRLKDVNAASLIPAARERLFSSIPKIARALSSTNRDVLLDSISIEERFRIGSMRAAESKIAEAFYGFTRHVAPVAKSRYGRDMRVVGVVHRISASVPDELRMFREYVVKSWRDEADVIDGETQDVGAEVDRLAAWVQDGGVSHN